jgi:hypothetical protein
MANDIAIIEPERFHTQHDLRTTTGDGKDLVVLSGYAEIDGKDLKGNSDGTWNRKDLRFMVGPRWIPVPDSVPVVSMTSIMNVAVANNAGWAVDDCTVSYFSLDPGPPGVRLQLTCRVAVRDSDGFMFRVNYHATTVGQLAPGQQTVKG